MSAWTGEGTILVIDGGSPRNRFVAQHLQSHGMGTLLFDLLTPEEERADLLGDAPPFDPRRTPADPEVGTLPEVFRQMPGTVVGDHPDGRFGARGRLATELVVDDLPWDVDGEPAGTVERDPEDKWVRTVSQAELRPRGDSDIVHVYEMGEGGGPHAELHVGVTAGVPIASPGAGGVHHVAFRVADDAAQERVADADRRASFT